MSSKSLCNISKTLNLNRYALMATRYLRGNFLWSFDIICTINVLFKNVRKDDLEICQYSNVFYFLVLQKHKCSLIARLNFHCSRYYVLITMLYLIFCIICVFLMKMGIKCRKCTIEIYSPWKILMARKLVRNWIVGYHNHTYVYYKCRIIY